MAWLSAPRTAKPQNPVNRYPFAPDGRPNGKHQPQRRSAERSGARRRCRLHAVLGAFWDWKTRPSPCVTFALGDPHAPVRQTGIDWTHGFQTVSLLVYLPARIINRPITHIKLSLYGITAFVYAVWAVLALGWGRESQSSRLCKTQSYVRRVQSH